METKKTWSNGVCAMTIGRTTVRTEKVGICTFKSLDNVVRRRIAGVKL